MDDVLHITNGDSASSLMQKGGVQGEILPWRDVLHDGPVPKCPDLTSLSSIRAKFINHRGWAEYEECYSSFEERNALLAAFANYESVCLWFEHDLYDQLQILQILDYLNCSQADHRRIEMICVDRYLGLMDPDEIASLGSDAREVTPAQLALASVAWQAYCHSTPEKWDALLDHDLSALPYLQGAIIRSLAEYPELETGLSRTEQQALSALHAVPLSPGALFSRNQSCEERIYMGDSSYWIVLQELMDGSHPLIQFEDGGLTLDLERRRLPMRLTEDGAAVLSGKTDRMQLHFPERWIGGVRLDKDTQWRWDADRGRIRSL